MRLAFLCGSLEMGKDGVGDYTRRLAGELTRQGHEIAAIALNDSHLSEENEDRSAFSTLRLPATWPSAQRFERAKTWLDTFEPEWISLQFVPFAFQKKGLVFGLAQELEKLTAGRKCHILFHELWVGMKRESPRKMILWGWLQRQLIFSLIRRLKPKILHTQTHLYVAQLARYGFQANFLPLFGNIPVQFPAELIAPGKRILLHFGTLYPQAPIEALAREVADFAKTSGTAIELQIIGRSGGETEHWAAIWKSFGLEMRVLGEQPPEIVSQAMAEASIGLATTAYALVEKSGSVAAMREHGLPVLCVSHEWQARGMPAELSPENVTEFRLGKLTDYMKTAQKTPGSTGVAEVARSFLESLSRSA